MSVAGHHRCRGLTLIEVLVATTIFAILGVLCYRAVDMAVTTRQRIELELERWQTVGRAMQRLQNSLQSMVPIQQRGATDTPALIVSEDSGGAPEMQFLRLDKRLGVHRQAIRLTDGRLYLLGWNGRAPLGEPAAELLLENVRQVRWSNFKGGAKFSAWPPAAREPAELPDAIAVELELADIGSISRLILLRW